MAKANFKVNEKTKTVSISGTLTELEKIIVQQYISSGYRLVERRQQSPKQKAKFEETRQLAVKDADILKYFEEAEDTEGRSAYISAKETMITIARTGRQRKGGTVYAKKWFRENYPEAYEAIKADKAKEAEEAKAEEEAVAEAVKAEKK